MQLVLEIEAQPATLGVARQGVLTSCRRDGSLFIESRDGIKPAQFNLTPSDNFPWNQFLPKLLLAWQLGDMEGVPDACRPQKRLPEFVLEGFGNEPLENQLKILSTLRKQGFFPKLSTK